MTLSQENTRYYFSGQAINIMPNINKQPQYVMCSYVIGARMKAFWERSLCERNIIASYPELGKEENKDTFDSALDLVWNMMYYAIDGVSFSSWGIVAKNTILETDGGKYNIYMRLDTNDQALLVFSQEQRNPVEFQVTEKEVSGDGSEDVDKDTTIEIKYIWIKVGELSGIEDNARTVLSFDTGCLGTDSVEWIRDQVGGDNHWYELDEGNKIIKLVSGWSFGKLIAQSIQTALYRFKRVNSTEWYDIEGILVEGDPVDKAENKYIATASWIKDTFYTWLQGKFVRKDNVNGTDVMEGSLEIKGSLKVKNDINAEKSISTKMFKFWRDSRNGYWAVNGILAGEDSIDKASDDTIGTTKWFFDTVKKWLGDKFVRKDNPNGVEEMQGSLKTLKSLTAVANINAKDAVISNAVTCATVSASGDISSDTKVIAPIHQTKNFASGEFLGTGAAMYQDEKGTGYVETDFLNVRRSAWFRELTIEEVKHVGGELILSQAACVVARVAGYKMVNGEKLWLFDTATDTPEEPKDAGTEYYRLFFDTEAGGKKQWNEWRPGDQVRCQSMGDINGAGTYQNIRTSYYWRVVTQVYQSQDGAGMHWIDVSNSTETLTYISGINRENYIEGPGCDKDCSTPKPNDSIALLGTRDKSQPSRSSAQVYSTAEANSPSRRFYQGITSFDLSGCEIETIEWNATKSCVHWRVGYGNDFIDFDNGGLRIQASSILLKGSSIDGVDREMVEEVVNGIVDDFIKDKVGEEIDAQFYGYTVMINDHQTKLVNWAAKDLGNLKEYYVAGLITQANIVSLFAEKLSTEGVPDNLKSVLTQAGFLAKAEYAQLFVKQMEDNKVVTSANITAAIEDGVSKAKISADQVIVDANENITLTAFKENVATKAEIKAAVDEGISNISLSADQININGNTNIKGIVVREPKYITFLNSKDNIRVSNDVYGMIYKDSVNKPLYEIPLDKLAATTYIFETPDATNDLTPMGYKSINEYLPSGTPEASEDPIHIFLPHYIEGVTDELYMNGNGNDQVIWQRLWELYYRSKHSSGTIPSLSWLPADKNSDMYKFVYGDGDWRGAKRMRGEKVYQARKYIGTQIQLVVRCGRIVHIHGVVDIPSYWNGENPLDNYPGEEGVDFPDQNQRILEVDGTSGPVSVVLECHQGKWDANPQAINYSVDSVYWAVTAVSTNATLDKYMMGLPDYPTEE